MMGSMVVGTMRMATEKKEVRVQRDESERKVKCDGCPPPQEGPRTDVKVSL